MHCGDWDHSKEAWSLQGRSQDFEEGGAITMKEGAKRRNLEARIAHSLKTNSFCLPTS